MVFWWSTCKIYVRETCPIDYANWAYFDKRSHLIPIKPNLAGVVAFSIYVWQPCPPFKIATVTNYRNYIFMLYKLK